MSSSHAAEKTDEHDHERDTFLDPNESIEEYEEDHPMSGDDDDDDDNDEDRDHDMLIEEVIVDDSIQGFFLHTSPIYSVALYDNYAATGSGDDLGYLWDVTTGEMILKLDGHTDSVTIVKFSHDGIYLATGGMDGQVRIWSVSELKFVVALEAGDEIMVPRAMSRVLIIVAGLAFFWTSNSGRRRRRNSMDVENSIGTTNASILRTYRPLHSGLILPLGEKHRHLLRRRKCDKLDSPNRCRGLENHRQWSPFPHK